MFYSINKPIKTNQNLQLNLNNRYDYEHIGRLAGSDYKWRKQMYLKKKLEFETATNNENKFNEKKEIHRQEFIKHSAEKIAQSEIQRLVNRAKEEQEEKLDGKRQRLKHMFQMENEIYENEINYKIATKIDISIKERERRLLGLKMERETQRKQFVEEKKLQQYFNDCDEIRPELHKKLSEKNKEILLSQIEYNKILQQIAKDEDYLWNEISKRVHNEMIKREENEQNIAHLRNLYDLKILKNQMNDIKIMKMCEKEKTIKENIKYNEKIVQNKIEDENLKIKQHEKKRIYASELNKQREEIQRIHKQTKENDAHMDKLFLDAVNHEIQLENKKLSIGNEFMKKETLLYLDYLREIKRKNQMSEIEKDKILREFLHESDMKTVKAMKERKEKQKALQLETAKIIEQQIEEQKRQRIDNSQREFEHGIKTNQMIEYNIKLDRNRANEKQRDSYAYGKELLAQNAYENYRKNDEKQMEKLEIQNRNDEIELRIKLARKFMEQNTNKLPIHPNLKVILKKS